MTSTERVAKHRGAAAADGRKRKEYLVTDTEHNALKALLAKLRNKATKTNA